MKLYEIREQYERAFNELSSIDGLTQEMINDSLVHIAEKFEEKAVNVAAYIKNLEAQAKCMKEYEDNMSLRRKQKEVQAERLREYLRFNMQMRGVNKINSTELDITIKKTLPKLIIEEEKIPKEWYREEVVCKLDKEAIRDAIQKGYLLEGAQLIENHALTIK